MSDAFVGASAAIFPNITMADGLIVHTPAAARGVGAARRADR